MPQTIIKRENERLENRVPGRGVRPLRAVSTLLGSAFGFIVFSTAVMFFTCLIGILYLFIVKAPAIDRADSGTGTHIVIKSPENAGPENATKLGAGQAPSQLSSPAVAPAGDSMVAAPNGILPPQYLVSPTRHEAYYRELPRIEAIVQKFSPAQTGSNDRSQSGASNNTQSTPGSAGAVGMGTSIKTQ